MLSSEAEGQQISVSLILAVHTSSSFSSSHAQCLQMPYKLVAIKSLVLVVATWHVQICSQVVFSSSLTCMHIITT